VRLAIDPAFDRLPRDTSASIFTAGLLGEQYVGLEPGGDERFLKADDEIRITQSALVLEQVVGQFLFSKAAEGPSEK
jgi:phospholipid/cholesterol/gamma-HCH transport system substrate-binding protein